MTFRTGALAVAALLSSACPSGNTVCSNDVDLTSKTGNCTGLFAGRVLGDPSTCSMRVSSCSNTETSAVSTALDCYSKLAVCDMATQGDWVNSRTTCGNGLSSLSQSCKAALLGGVLPGEDAGVDAGPPVDAGRQPIDDGGNGISMVVVADEKSFAFAWVPLQQAPVQTWELNAFDTVALSGAGKRLPEVGIPGGLTRTYELPDVGPGVGRRFYLAGIDQMSQLAYGFIPDAGSEMDAGATNCSSHAQCTVTQVCDLGMCATQTCQMSATCPQPDYVCDPLPHTCRRTMTTNIDGGMMMMMTAPDARLPMISQSTSVTTGMPTFGETFIGSLVAKRPDIVAIDSARQFVAIEQMGVPVGHFTVSRGKDFPLEQNSASIIDTLGTNVRVAFNAENQVLYACYSVGRGVRVRRSRDYGKSWGTSALTIEPEDDGGTTSTIGDCDIAAWKNGTALMVTVDDDQLVTRQINEILAVNGNPDVAFVSSPPDAGGYNIFLPRRPAMATLPSADLVHIGFTASRIVSGLTDSDIYGVFRDSSTAGIFSNPSFINNTGVTFGSTFAQDGVSVAIDPVTKRGVATWTSLENTGSGSYTTAYVGFFNNGTKKWITGSDLSVFMQFNGNFPLFPARTTGLWDAFGPQVAVMRDGRVWVMVLAGERSTPANEIYSYGVEFAFDAGSPVGGQGWFKPPTTKMSNTKALDPRGGGNSVPFSNTAFTADSQLSIYGVFIEGIGTLGSEENRAVFITRP